MSILHKTTRQMLTEQIMHLCRQLMHDRFASQAIQECRKQALEKLIEQRNTLDKTLR